MTNSIRVLNNDEIRLRESTSSIAELISPEPDTKETRFDKIGIFASTICLIHCLALPLLLPSISLIHGNGDVHNHEFFHFLLFPILLFMAGAAIVSGYRKHKNPLPIYFASFGIFLLGGTLVNNYLNDALSDFTVFMNSCGSISLILAHSLNISSSYKLKASRSCQHKNCDCHSVR